MHFPMLRKVRQIQEDMVAEEVCYRKNKFEKEYAVDSLNVYGLEVLTCNRSDMHAKQAKVIGTYL